MNLYFDHAAAMEPLSFPDCTDLQTAEIANQENPVSGAQKIIDQAASDILTALCPDRHTREQYGVFFTHTGTDAVNAAFAAAGSQCRTGTAALSGGEHACVRAAVRRLSGIRQVIFPCDSNGVIAQETFDRCITEDTVLTAVHLVQPETGVIQNMPSLSARKKSLLLVDAIQGAGKIPFDFSAVQPDFFTLSGQKLGALSGAALICRKTFLPVLKKLRLEQHSTGRVPPVLAKHLAAVLCSWVSLQEQRAFSAQELKDLLFAELERTLPGVFRRTIAENVPVSPYITHLLFPGYQGAILTRALSGRGIITSPGSACDAETDRPSEALTWMGIPSSLAFCALRISFSPANDRDGVCTLVRSLAEILRQY